MRKPILLLLLLALPLSVRGEDSERLRGLRQQLLEVSGKLQRITDEAAKADPSLAKLREEAHKATAALQNELTKNPGLSDANQDMREALNRLTNAIGRGDAAAKEAATRDYTALTQKRNEEAKKLPAFEPVFKARAETHAALARAENEVISKSSVATALVKQQAKLQQEIARERQAQP